MASDRQHSIWYNFSSMQKIMWFILIGLYVAMLVALALVISNILY